MALAPQLICHWPQGHGWWDFQSSATKLQAVLPRHFQRGWAPLLQDQSVLVKDFTWESWPVKLLRLLKVFVGMRLLFLHLDPSLPLPPHIALTFGCNIVFVSWHNQRQPQKYSNTMVRSYQQKIYILKVFINFLCTTTSWRTSKEWNFKIRILPPLSPSTPSSY